MRITLRTWFPAVLIAALLAASFSLVTPAHAVCMVSYANIATIAGTTTQDTYTYFTLSNAASFNASLFPSNSVNVDKYNTLAAQFAQNNDSVPPHFADTQQGYVIDRIGVPTAALNSISYQTGDIIIIGSPYHGGCGSSSFIGIFSPSGVIKSAISRFSDTYTYGSDTLTITAGTPSTDCQSNGGTFSVENICTTPLLYSLNGVGFTLNPGDTKTLPGNFAQVNLITSTYSTINSGTWIEDFDPTNITQTITFNASSTPPDTGIQALIKSLLLQVQRLQQQLRDLQNHPTPPGPPNPPVPPSLCMNLTHSLSIDSTDADSGGDVTRLQQFLAQDSSIYPEGRITGYFGPATERAVQRWQARNGIIASGDPDSTGYGFVGAKTRAAMNTSCNGPIYPQPPVNQNFTASPMSGAAPLNVTFIAPVPPNFGSGGDIYTVDFGDGGTGTMSISGFEQISLQVSHQYTANGTYTATLKKTTAYGIDYSGGCSGDCGAILNVANQADTQVVGTITINVGPQMCTQQYVYCPAGTHNGGVCNQSCIPDACPASPPQQPDSSTCPNGTWRANTNGSCTVGWQCTPSSGSGPFMSVSPTSGSAPLKVIASISALAAIDTTQQMYVVDFGDGSAPTGMQCPSDCTSFPGSYPWMPDHTYQAAGTYTISLRLKNGDVTGAHPDYTSWLQDAQTLLTKQVTVSSTNPTTLVLTASPTSGSAPLPVTFSAKVPSGSYALDFGDGVVSPISVPAIVCIQAPCNPGPVSIQHTYATVGTYTTQLKQTGQTGSQVIGIASVTVSNTTPTSFTISPVSGIAPLNVTFISGHGTWGVGGEGREVVFGDGTAAVPVQCAPANNVYGTDVPCSAPVVIQHTYWVPGSYVVAFRSTPPSTTLAYNNPHVVLSSQTVSVGGITTAATNSALTILTSTQTVEKAYLATMQQIAITAAGICTQGSALQTQTAQNITASQNTLTTLAQLISGVTSDSSNSAQSTALQQLDALVAQGKVHTQANVDQANATLTSVPLTLSGACTVTSGGIPAAVQSQYDALIPTYGQSLGVFISSCVKSGNNQIYTVTGSGGFSGITYYFNGGDGRALGSVTFQDTPPFLSGAAPVDTSQFVCTQVKSSRSASF